MTWKLSNFNLSGGHRPIHCAFALLPIFLAIHFLGYWLRYEGQMTFEATQAFWQTVGFAVLAKTVAFGWFRVYHGWNKYATFHDLMVLVKAATASSALAALINYLVFRNAMAPRSVFLMDWGATIVVVGGLRSLARLIEERGVRNLFATKGTPVLIVGTNDAGETLLRAIRRERHRPFHVVGFITENGHNIASCISGVPVIGRLDQTCTLAEKFGVAEVLLTAGYLSGQQVRKLVEDGRQVNVAVKVVPSYEQLLTGKVSLQPRTVSIEDLLRRDPVQLDLHQLHQWIDGKVLLVTGSAGSIGSELCRQLLQFAPKRLVLVDRSENGQFFLERELRRLAPDRNIETCIADIGDDLRMARLFGELQPDIVFHAAAYKHVPLMEANPGEAVKNTVLATRRLADLAHQQGVTTFVMISTDKAVNPTSIMGTCKRVAELYVQALAAKSRCRFVTVRFGNVLDSAGSVVPIFREQIAAGGPVTVTHPDMLRFFMTIPEASQLVVQAGAMGQGGEIFVLDMGEPVRIVDLAADMIRLSGLKLGQDIDIEFVGMRPGEKLFEELHVDGERHLGTSHPKIMVAESPSLNLHAVSTAIDALARAAEAPHNEILEHLRRIVPQYRGEQSPVPQLKIHRAA